MREIRPILTAHHDSSKPFVFKELKQATHVFRRNDTVRGSLQPSYDGPFEVKEKQCKYFTINTGSRCIKVSIDRLKPAFIETPQPIIPPPNPSSDFSNRIELNKSSRPRRTIRLPVRFTSLSLGRVLWRSCFLTSGIAENSSGEIGINKPLWAHSLKHHAKKAH